MLPGPYGARAIVGTSIVSNFSVEMLMGHNLTKQKRPPHRYVLNNMRRGQEKRRILIICMLINLLFWKIIFVDRI
jgi:hypothetical protein